MAKKSACFYVFLVTVSLLATFAGCTYLSCDFDDDFCGYEPNEFVVRYRGKSPSLSSGPIADHTTGEEGYYALCDGRQLRNPKDECTLKKLVKVSATSTFSFWYYMFGSQVGTLELIVDGESVWSLTGSQDKNWLKAEVTLNEGDLMIEFKANRSEAGRVAADLAIDDIGIESEEITTKMTTVTRSSPKPAFISGCEFDLTMCGWQTDYIFNRWFQTNGNMSSYFDMLGPASDWTSLATSVLGSSLQPLNTLCAVPYCIKGDDGSIQTHYYCKRHFLRNRPSCGQKICPNLVDNSMLDICNLGNYLLISNDRFSMPSSSFRSRLYSPVFQPKVGIQTYCLRYKYNIVTENPGDGFSIFIEDYYNPDDILLTTKKGKLSIDRWHSESILIKNIDKFSSLRFVIQPFRLDTSLPLDNFASVSIDSIHFMENDCSNDDEDPPVVIDLNTVTTTTTSTTTTTTTTTTETTTTTTTPMTTTTTTTTSVTGSTSASPTSEQHGSAPGTDKPESTAEPEGSTSPDGSHDSTTSSSVSSTSTTRTSTTPTSSTTRERTTTTTTRPTTTTTVTPTQTTTTLKTVTFSQIDQTKSPKKSGGNLYVNIFVPIASVALAAMIIVGVYVVAKKKGIKFPSLKRNRSIAASNDNIGPANSRSNTNEMELGNNK